MLGVVREDCLACSPDFFALIDVGKLENEAWSASITTNSGIAVVEHVSFLSSAEIKTRVASGTVECALTLATAEIICCNVGDETFR